MLPTSFCDGSQLCVGGGEVAAVRGAFAVEERLIGQRARVRVQAALDVAVRSLVDATGGVDQTAYSYIQGRLNPYSSALTDQPFFYRERTPNGRNFATTYALRADIINRTNCDPSQKLVGSIADHNITATNLLVGRTFCNFNLNDFNEVQSAGKDANILSRGTFKVNESITAFAEASYARSERTYVGPARTVSSTSSSTVFAADGKPSSQFQLILPVGHPDNPFTAANGYTPSRTAVGFRMMGHQGGSDNVNETYRLLAGLKGTAGRFDWETGVLLNRNERTEHYFGMLYRPVMERIMTEGRTIAQTIADPNATRNLENNGFSQVMQIDAKATTTIGKLPGGDIGLAFGGEARQEKIGLTPDKETQAGNIIGLANSVADGQRNVKSAFIELRTPFFKNFEMDFAGRYDKYPAVSSFVPKVGSKWTVSEQIAVRGTYARGFRAPALTQVSPGGVQSFQTVTDSIRCPDGVNPLGNAAASDCNKSISSLSAANPQLKPEKSKSASLGLILQPTKNLDVLIDFYNIKLRDETALLSAQTVVDKPSQYPGAVVIRDTNPANQLVLANGTVVPNSGPLLQVNRSYINQGSTEVGGVDLEVTLRQSLGDWGRLSSTLNWSYLATYKRAMQPGDTTHNTAGSNGGLSDWHISASDNPRNRASFSTNWTYGVHSLTGIVDFVDHVSLMRRFDNEVVYPVPYCYYGTSQPSPMPCNTAYRARKLPTTA
eukprot:gene24407-30750_t